MSRKCNGEMVESVMIESYIQESVMTSILRKAKTKRYLGKCNGERVLRECVMVEGYFKKV